MGQQFDAIIIGAGLSGIAAGIRLAMFDKKVCIVEKHSIPGGLNSYYKRGDRLLDVGLHAMTNFASKGSRGKPLTKLLKQLRIPYSDFSLSEQNYSKIVFPDIYLKFSNNIDLLLEEINQNFPKEVDGFNNLIGMIQEYNETSLEHTYHSAKEVVSRYIHDLKLRDMIFFPLMIYGSAWEDDMDFSQFAIMFKSIFLEGFSRPKGGVRTILDLLINKFETLGGVIEYKCDVVAIISKNNMTSGIELKCGKKIFSSIIFSSIGRPETLKLSQSGEASINSSDIGQNHSVRAGIMSFTETILMSKKTPKVMGEEATIVFYNEQDRYDYKCPNDFYDSKSAVLCFSNNFEDDDFSEGVTRVTNIANFKLWHKLSRKDYKLKKKNVLDDARKMLMRYSSKLDFPIEFSDVFTPLTVKKFTSRINGAVYGSPDKIKTGKTQIGGLYICGTDQGFLGIVGAMLSGISMANLHVLSKE